MTMTEIHDGDKAMPSTLPVLFTTSLDICIAKLDSMPDLNAVAESRFLSLTATSGEISLVCETSCIPTNAVEVNRDWRCLAIEGVLDFALTGILAPIAHILAENKISIFALSSFDTDFILVKAEYLEDASSALRRNGYTVRNES